MAVSRRGFSHAGTGEGGNTSISVNKPTANSGDMLIAIAAREASGTISPPANWTTILAGRAWSRDADAAGAGPYTFTSSPGCMFDVGIWSVYNENATTPKNADTATLSASITPTLDGCLLLASGQGDGGWSSHNSVGAIDTFTTEVSGHYDDGDNMWDFAFCHCYKAQATAASVTLTMADAATAYLLAVAPVSSRRRVIIIAPAR